MTKLFAFAGAALAATTVPAFAHVGTGEHGSLFAGLLHPLLGLDHALTILAVGLWAASLGAGALWLVPAAFIAAMVAGFGLGLVGVSLPLVEPTILASVVVLGLALAVAVRLPVTVGAALVGLFAVFHGYAHAGEIGAASALPFGVGFVAATALVHSIGAGLGTRLTALSMRASGVGIALTGIVLAIG